MKNKNNKIQNEVNQTMKLFDEVERLKAGDDFYKKINYHLHARLEEERLQKRGLRGLLKPAALTAITLLNVFSAYLVLSDQQQYEVDRSQQLTSFSEEYHLTSTDSDWLNYMEEGE